MLLACLLATALCGCTREPLTPAADRVFFNGAVYTIDAQRSWASAVAVQDGRIVFVGDDAGVITHIGESSEVIDLAGRMLMPGFHDSHMHPMRAGTRFLRCQLGGLGWPEQVVKQLRECEASLEAGKWLRGTGLTEAAFEEQGPHKSLLDEIAPDRPALISNRNGYLSWANSITLDLAGIDKNTPDPEKGIIERDAVSSEPRGVLRNMANGLVYALASRYSEAEYREALRLASAMANRFGITSTNAAKLWPDNWAAYVAADQAGELTLRIQGSLSWNWEAGLEQLEAMRLQRDDYNGTRFRSDAVKLALDGNFIDHTASLIEPYAGTNNDFGRALESSEVLNEIVAALDAEGFQAHFHAVGDAAVRRGLDAIEHAMTVNGPRDRRHHMAHIKLIHPDDLPRFAALGVTADFQPLWAHQGGDTEREIVLLGETRGRRMMAMKSIFGTGARVVAGSDWISESMNPLHAIQVAVTRRPPDGSAAAWVPEERVSLEEMLAAYTINGAWLARQERETGSIEVGKAADLIVLERNLFEVEPMELKDVRVLLTLLEGEVVYRDPEFGTRDQGPGTRD